MGIEAQFTKEEVQERLDALLEQIQKYQIRRLQMLGEMCVNHARSVPKSQGFEDQTGNLRSSIGYAVFVNGIAVHSFYEPASVQSGSRLVKRKRKLKDGTIKEYQAKMKIGGDGAVGAQKGQELATKVGEKTNGVCLVVTAGMNYALYVESRGRDVIASAEQLAKRELPRMLEKLIDNIKKAAE